MENIKRRINFVCDDLHQMLFSDPGIDRSTFLAMLDAYRSLICLSDVLGRKKL